jgi:hypothetical protein
MQLLCPEPDEVAGGSLIRTHLGQARRDRGSSDGRGRATKV